jgi:hypothetical protein
MTKTFHGKAQISTEKKAVTAFPWINPSTQKSCFQYTNIFFSLGMNVIESIFFSTSLPLELKEHWGLEPSPYSWDACLAYMSAKFIFFCLTRVPAILNQQSTPIDIKRMDAIATLFIESVKHSEQENTSLLNKPLTHAESQYLSRIMGEKKMQQFLTRYEPHLEDGYANTHDTKEGIFIDKTSSLTLANLLNYAGLIDITFPLVTTPVMAHRCTQFFFPNDNSLMTLVGVNVFCFIARLFSSKAYAAYRLTDNRFHFAVMIELYKRGLPSAHYFSKSQFLKGIGFTTMTVLLNYTPVFFAHRKAMQYFHAGEALLLLEPLASGLFYSVTNTGNVLGPEILRCIKLDDLNEAVDNPQDIRIIDDLSPTLCARLFTGSTDLVNGVYLFGSYLLATMSSYYLIDTLSPEANPHSYEWNTSKIIKLCVALVMALLTMLKVFSYSVPKARQQAQRLSQQITNYNFFNLRATTVNSASPNTPPEKQTDPINPQAINSKLLDTLLQTTLNNEQLEPATMIEELINSENPQYIDSPAINSSRFNC